MENKTYNITYTEDNNGVYHLYLNGEITATLPKNIDHYELVDIIQNFVLDYDNFNKVVIQNDGDNLGVIVDIFDDEYHIAGKTYWFEDFETSLNFAIDIPSAITNHRGEYQEWINIEFFKTKQEAIDFVKEHFGADENGMVCLVSTI